MAESSSRSLAVNYAHRDDQTEISLEAKHKIFLSHSGAQKLFVEYLCIELERCLRYPFFDLREHSLPLGEVFPKHIFDAIQQCHVGVVILSKEFLASKWPMMELVAMVEEAEKRTNFKLIPVFLEISPAELSNVENHEQRVACWYNLALENPGRIDLARWESAVKYVRVLNGLVKGGMLEYQFLKLIVDRICAIVPAEMKLDDSHIQGKLRLCKIVQSKIDLQLERKDNAISIVGMHGMGGMGKTTMCKALCNEYFTRFRGKVCHVELERVNEEVLLRDVLSRLSNTSRAQLNEFNLSEMRNGLKEGLFIKDDPIFLALDNVSDTNASIMEAKVYLSAKLPQGSIVFVTTRYKQALVLLGSYIDMKDCFTMPGLEDEEARALFVKSCDGKTDDDGLIDRCIQRCYFSNDGSETKYEYHPLALEVLGRELGWLEDTKEWAAQLDMIDKDVFNQRNDKDYHPVFSILRKSFDSLGTEDQFLFMDVARFQPQYFYLIGSSNVLEWLGMVHNIGVEDVEKRLDRLKKKSLLESFGTFGSITRIGIHDLWREFSVAEAESGELSTRRWVYEKRACSDSSPCEASPSGNCWQSVKRMAFLEFEQRSLERVNFAHFANVTVLKITMVEFERELVVDLSRLVWLKSLEIIWTHISRGAVQGLPRSLVFLRLVGRGGYGRIFFDQIRKHIEGLERLQYLGITGYNGKELPDMKRMVSLRKAVFRRCFEVVSVGGLSSNLRVLVFVRAPKLRTCLGVGELVALEELSFRHCLKLEGLPNLEGLKKLRKLDVFECKMISELRGLGNLVALQKLTASWCGKLMNLPSLHKLTNLQVLDLDECSSLDGVRGLEHLTSLEVLQANFQAIVEKPKLRQLTELQRTAIQGWNQAGIVALGGMSVLRKLTIDRCNGVDMLPDLQSLIRLEEVYIKRSDFKDLGALCNLRALERLLIYECKNLEILPNFQRLTSLEFLEIGQCPKLSGWDSTLVPQGKEKSLVLEYGKMPLDNPISVGVPNLKILKVYDCGMADLRSVGAFSQLELLRVCNLPVSELPDLSNFPQLMTLELEYCDNLSALVSRVPLNALLRIEIYSCRNLATLPNPPSLPNLRDLSIGRCPEIRTLGTSEPWSALAEFEIRSCRSLTVLPDLGMYPALRKLTVFKCSGLSAVSSSSPSTALSHISIEYCRNLTTLPDLCNILGLRELLLRSCDGISTLNSRWPLTSLTTLKMWSCNALVALPDLHMFPSLIELGLDGCGELTSLSSSVPLTALQYLNVKGCTKLSRDDLEHLREMCPEHCEILSGTRNGEVGDGCEILSETRIGGWRWWPLGLCGAIVMVGYIMSK